MNWCILVLLFAANLVHAQKGFLNIACGSKSNFTDDRGLVWVPDTKYIQLGQAQRVFQAMSSEDVYMRNMRKFPKPLNKSCYGIPWSSTHPFLLRLSFYNNTWPRMFNYSVETADMLYESNNLDAKDTEYEHILVTMGTTVYICLNRMSEATDPFISAIQMIELKHGMYRWAKPTVMLVLQARLDIGGEDGVRVRYPIDNFDRIWESLNVTITPAILNSTSSEIDGNSTAEVPPSAVMQTAQMMDSSITLSPGPFDPSMKLLLLLYLSEIDKSSERVSFNVSDNGKIAANVTLVRNYTAMEIALQPEPNKSYSIVFSPLDGKSKVPLNALEAYSFANKKQGTFPENVKALNDLKNTQTSNSLTKYWVSDPCFILPWRYISCTPDMRVSHLYLSGKKFSGYLPQSLGHLTALVYLDLSNNSFKGPLPDLSKLTLLEAIVVSNNKLDGTLESLAKLTKYKLKKVFVENNNFSGEIPRELEQLVATNFSYSGNQRQRIMLS